MGCGASTTAGAHTQNPEVWRTGGLGAAITEEPPGGDRPGAAQPDGATASRLLPKPTSADSGHGQVSPRTEGVGSSAGCEQGRKTPPRDPSSWRSLGRALQQQGQYAQAVDAYSKAVQLDHQDLDSLYCRGECHLELGETKSGLQDLQTVEELASASPGDSALAAQAKALRGQHQETARLQVRRATAQTRPKITSSAGEGRLPEAVPEKQWPKLPDLYSVQACAPPDKHIQSPVQTKQGDDQQVLEDLSQGEGVEGNNDDDDRDERADENDEEEIWRHVQQLQAFLLDAEHPSLAHIAFNPEDIMQFYAWGYDQFMKGQYARAEQVFVMLTTAFPRSSEPWRALGAVQQQLQKYELAVQSYTAALLFNAGDIVSLVYRGESKLKMQDMTGAALDLRSAQQLVALYPQYGPWGQRANLLLATYHLI